MRKGFTKTDLEEEFEKIGGRLEKRTEVFLLGGGAMCFRGQKNATKDLDLVFKTAGDFKGFAVALARLGFTEPAKLEFAYEEMKASGIWQNKPGFRFDLFVKTVCGALSLSDDMVSRSELLGDYGNLIVRMVSNEDVLLFKGITERPADVTDMAEIIRLANINWNVLLQECRNQSKTRAWYGSLYNKMLELEERGIAPPITKTLEELDKKATLRAAYQLRITRGLNRASAVEELVKLGFTEKEIDEALRD